MTAALRNTQATPNLRPMGLALTGLIAAGALIAGLAGAQSAMTPKAAPQANAAPAWDHGTSVVAAAPAWDHGTSIVAAAPVFDHGTSLANDPKTATWQNGVNTYTGFTAVPTFTAPASWDHGTSTTTSPAKILRAGGPSRLRVR